MTGLDPVVERCRQPGQVLEHHRAQVVLEVVRRTEQQEPGRIARDSLSQREREHHDDVGRQRMLVRDERVVDRCLHRGRDEHLHDDPEQRAEVDAEAERGHGGEGADDGDRHGGRRHQHGAPVLQEDQDHHQNEEAGLEQRLVDLIDRFLHEFGGVERRVVLHALREGFGELRHLLLDGLLDLECVGAR